MTVEQKINEASLWLEHIHFYSPDISIVKYYFAAFLSATASIQDYILAEANEFYQLELPMGKTWHKQKLNVVLLLEMLLALEKETHLQKKVLKVKRDVRIYFPFLFILTFETDC